MLNKRATAVLVLLLLASVLLISRARANGETSLPPGYSCHDVRKHVRSYGITLALAWARVNGLTSEQIKEIRRVCKV